MGEPAEKYRRAAIAAQAQAHKAMEPAAKEAWLRHVNEWSRIADELESSGQ